MLNFVQCVSRSEVTGCKLCYFTTRRKPQVHSKLITLTLIINCMGGGAPRNKLRWVGYLEELITLGTITHLWVIYRWSLYARGSLRNTVLL